MSNIVLATPELSDAATVTSSGETAAGPVENLKRLQPTDIWQAPTLTPYIEIDLGAVTSFNLVSLLFTNATAGAIWRVRTADTQLGLTTAPDHNVSSLPLRHSLVWIDVAIGESAPIIVAQSPDTGDKRNHAVLWVPGGWSNRWIRIDITDTGNPDGTFMAGRLYVSNALQPTYNHDYGAADGFDDDSTIDRTDGGQLIPNDGANRPVFEFTLNTANESERHTVREINRKRGSSKDVLIVTDPNAAENPHDFVKYGLLQRRRVAVNTAFNRHQVNYQMTGL